MKKEINFISNKTGIHTYFYDYSASEINNLCGTTNIFLNKNQTEKEIWDDFCNLLICISMEDPYGDDV